MPSVPFLDILRPSDWVVQLAPGHREVVHHARPTFRYFVYLQWRNFDLASARIVVSFF